MPRIRTAIALSLLIVVCAGGGTRAEDEPVARPVSLSVETLDGRALDARRLAAVGPTSITVERESGREELPLDGLVALRFATPVDPARPPSGDEAWVDLWSGEELRGRIQSGDGDGIVVAAPLVGTVTVALDHVAGIRFPARLLRVADPPDLATNGDLDVVHMTGGDRITGSFLSFSGEALEIEPEGGGPASKVPYAQVTGLRLARYEAEPSPGTALDVVLRDGTRVSGSGARLDGERLALTSRSGFDASMRLSDVIELHVRNDRFRYLSDVKPRSIDVKPFWEMTDGSPQTLYAPRMDRSFGGRRLSCGGRTWSKGVGVFGGTSITWDLDGKYREFRASVGLDDGAGDLGGVVFEVIVDGKTRWTSGFVRSATGTGRGKPGPLRVDKIVLDGAKSLTLRVTTGDAEDPYPIQDEGDWLGALLVK